MKRNNLTYWLFVANWGGTSEEEANQRIDSQWTDEQRKKFATRVFGTLISSKGNRCSWIRIRRSLRRRSRRVWRTWKRIAFPNVISVVYRCVSFILSWPWVLRIKKGFVVSLYKKEEFFVLLFHQTHKYLSIYNFLFLWKFSHFFFFPFFILSLLDPLILPVSLTPHGHKPTEVTVQTRQYPH